PASLARWPPCCPPRCRPATSSCWHWATPLLGKVHSTSAATKPESIRGPAATEPGQQQEAASRFMTRHSTLAQPSATALARPMHLLSAAAHCPYLIGQTPFRSSYRP